MELYFAECVTVLNEHRLDYTRYKQYETKLLRRLDKLDISPFFKQKIRSCSMFVETNPYARVGARTSAFVSDKSIDQKISLLLRPFNYNTKHSIYDKFQIPIDWQSFIQIK